MKKAITFFLVIITGISLFALQHPAFADGDNCVNTIIIGGPDHRVCDSDGESIFALLHLIIDIMTIGVGILGVIGISVTGIQYLTAGGNEEQTRKAKRRMFEIIVGLAIYATFFLVMQWLTKDFEIKEGSFDGSGGSSQTTTPGGNTQNGASSGSSQTNTSGNTQTNTSGSGSQTP